MGRTKIEKWDNLYETEEVVHIFLSPKMGMIIWEISKTFHYIFYLAIFPLLHGYVKTFHNFSHFDCKVKLILKFMGNTII